METSDFSERLVMARQAEGLSQRQLASMLGISQQAYAYYEGGREMKAGLIRNVCSALKCSPGWLLGMEEDGASLPPESPLMTALREAFCKLNRHGQEKVVGYADDLTGNSEYRVSVKKRDEDSALPRAVGE